MNANNKGLFIYRDGREFKAQDFRLVLKEAIRHIGLDNNNYDTHSLCIGQAKDLQRNGLSVEDIKQMGRWKSNAVFQYLNKL